MDVDQTITLSVVNARPGGFVGHLTSHPDIIDTAKERLFNAREKGWISDFHVLRCGDDIQLVMTHRKGLESPNIKNLAFSTIEACEEVARELKLFSTPGEPSFAEVEFQERRSEPVVIFMANKTALGTWNLPLFKAFADPFNTAGLVLEPEMFEGFSFQILDTSDGSEFLIKTPEETYWLLALIGATSRYVVSSVRRKADGEPTAVTSTRKLTPQGRPPVASENPILITRCEEAFPSVGEVLEALTLPHLVQGWLKGAHNGPLMPVPFYEANPTRFDGPPRIIGAGFHVSDGRLIGPHDMFDDPSFDESRRVANVITEYLRRHGPFEPHLSGVAKSKTVNIVLDRLKERAGR